MLDMGTISNVLKFPTCTHMYFDSYKLERNSNNKIKAYRISLPQKYSKKYIGLLFDDCDNDGAAGAGGSVRTRRHDDRRASRPQADRPALPPAVWRRRRVSARRGP